MRDKSKLEEILRSRDSISPNLTGRQRFINYSFKQKLIFVLTFLFILYVSCVLFNSIYTLMNGIRGSYSNFPLSTYMMAFKYNVFAFILFALFSYFVSRFITSFFRGELKDERGYKLSKAFKESSSKFLSESLKRKIYKLTDVKEAVGGTILGEDKKTGEVIILPFEHKDPDYEPDNQHIALIGSSGTRKTSSILINKVFTAIAAGHSVVTTDPKMEISSETLAVALAYGYKTLFLNLLPGHFEESDGWDVIKLLRESDDPLSTADLMTNIILSNTGSGLQGDAFWQDANINCLKVHLLTVACAKGFVSDVEGNSSGNARTMGALYSLIASKDSEDRIRRIINAGGSNGDKELLEHSFNVWAGHDRKNDIKSGLGIKLSILQNKNLARILSEDEIDFKTLNDEKTILYIICSDQDTTYKSILSLFCNFLFKEMSSIADSKEKQRLDRPLDIIFEEAKNIGKIVGISQKVATIRSRGMSLLFAYQNIGQMKDDYGSTVDGKYEWETILTNCATKLFLGGDDETSTKYFSALSGEMFVDVQTRGKEVGTLNPVKFSLEENIRTTPTKMPVLRPDEIKNLEKNQILICPSKRNVTIEKKFYYKKHPLYGYKLIDSNGEITAFNKHPHIPKWKKKDILKDIALATGNADESIFKNQELSYTYVKSSVIKDEPLKEQNALVKSIYGIAPFLFETDDEEEVFEKEYKNSNYKAFIRKNETQTGEKENEEISSGIFTSDIIKEVKGSDDISPSEIFSDDTSTEDGEDILIATLDDVDIWEE